MRLLSQKDFQNLDPNHEACNAIMDEADKICKALPPDPASRVQTSGSAIYRGGKPVMIDGKPVCP